MSIHEVTLLALIDDLLAGELNFEAFSSAYYDYYLEVLPPLALSEDQSDFYAAIHEKLDWTAVEVDEESRGYGWISAAEFLIWLRAERDAYTPGMDRSPAEIEALVDALVSDVAKLEAWWAEYRVSDEYLPEAPHVTLGGLGSVVVEEFGGAFPVEADRFFTNLEDRLLRDDADERGLLVVGLLEAIQNVSLNRGIPLTSWQPVLGVTTRRYWANLAALWGGELAPEAFNATLGTDGLMALVNRPAFAFNRADLGRVISRTG